jgi:arylsulfatase A-like enzyme
MDDKRDEQKQTGVNRRRFIGALGAAAAAGAFLGRRGGGSAQAASSDVLYQDSFGNIQPVSAELLAMGIYPPPIPSPSPSQPSGNSPDDGDDACGQGTSGTYYTCGWPHYNILLIMVDQMRSPAFWLPNNSSGLTGQAAIDAAIPNIAALRNQSWIFPNYSVAATICGPSRACLLTGLYSQQTCIFRSQSGANPAPTLLNYNPSWTAGGSASPGFPTIGNVLSQTLPIGNGNGKYKSVAYNCAWIGKWHLSCSSGTQDGTVGENGPYDYGFTNPFCIPNTVEFPSSYPRGANGYPSPDGQGNEGNGGDFLDSFAQSTPARDVPNFASTGPLNPSAVQLNDAAIADAFGTWLANAAIEFPTLPATPTDPPTPWFCAVSFVNPHDISDFPYPFGLTTSTSPVYDPADFTGPTGTPTPTGYQPPPQAGGPAAGTDCKGGSGDCASDGDNTYIPAYSPVAPYAVPPSPWNWEDPASTALEYNRHGTTGGGKPGLQAYFENQRNLSCGIINPPGSDPNAWLVFLNYYFWMQSCVDYQVGRVLGTNTIGTNNGLMQNSAFWGNTVIVFTSDHGDYGGSHNLHAKGGGLYDEVMQVPLYVSYPEQRATQGANTSVSLPYVCSAVDILPLLYYLALGNNSWRSNPSDMIYYLSIRDAIHDAIYEYNNGNPEPVPQRRISSIPLANPPAGGTANWQKYQPFVLHTADDYSSATAWGGPHPSHAIAFRTADPTDSYTNPNGQTAYGGGKLGIYSYWYTCNNPASNAPIEGINSAGAPNEYEFYNYSQAPPGGLAENPAELGNQAFSTSGSGAFTTEAQAYHDDFFNVGSPGGINIQDELYNLYVTTGSSTSPYTLQVQAAIQLAYCRYICFLAAGQQATGADGTINPSCTVSLSACPTCSS